MKIFLFCLVCLIGAVASANECRMTIQAKIQTNWPVLAGLFNERDEKVAVMSIVGNGETLLKNLFYSQYKVIFKDGQKYAESQIPTITYTVTVTGSSTNTSWQNGTVQYFVTHGRSNGKVAADKYHF
jgi:hypothetical protein